MDPTELAYAGVARQAELIRAREVSPLELVDLYLERIERIDPQLNSFRTVAAERARAEARQAEARVGAGDERPLLGVPVAVKDNIDVAGEVTAHGSAAFGAPAAEDAEMVRRLREAGAILIGRTQMPELAIWPATESEAWGITRNPWDTSRTPGGSSGGSGAAVAAGLVAGGVATDGGGSIRIPAACTGLVGLKTQRGRVRLSGAEEHWHGLSVAGAVTRHTIDTALWLDVVAGGAGAPDPDRPYVEAATTPPGKLRVAVSVKSPDPLVKVSGSVRRAIEEMAEVLRSLGHEVHERDPDTGWVLPLFLPRWAVGIRDEAESMAIYDALETRTRHTAALGRMLGMRGVRFARDREEARARQVNAIFDDADVLMTPTIPHPPDVAGYYARAGIAGSINRASTTVVFANIWNVTGQPALAVPTQSTGPGGVPLSAQLVGRPNDEGTLLSLGAQLEAEIGWPERRPPVG
ncbi:MAG TPA: amidase [Thermoleophilaceae bacterium]|jgi:amidase